MKTKKVLVSGCFDLLHSGHVAFLKSAATFGKVYVAVGQDQNLLSLKGKIPYFSQAERMVMVNAIRYVEQAFISGGRGVLDFEPDLKRIKPDIFVVNHDGHTPEKEALCRECQIEYITLERVPDEGLPIRSSSEIKNRFGFPYRICIAGGWMDQPWMSEIHPGSVVVAQLAPTLDFNDRSGMATSSRNVALELWGDHYPEGDPIRNAQLLFGAENPPGSQYVSGSQDHIGLLKPGINHLHYNGDYWPDHIDSITDPDICEWLSGVLHLIPLKPRPDKYNPLKKKSLNQSNVKELGEAGRACWTGILKKDIDGLGQAMSSTYTMWRRLLPETVPDSTWEEVRRYENYPGAITSGSGGGYIVIASEDDVPGAFSIQVRY